MTDTRLAFQNKHHFTRAYYSQRSERAKEILLIVKILHDSTQDFMV